VHRPRARSCGVVERQVARGLAGLTPGEVHVEALIGSERPVGIVPIARQLLEASVWFAVRAGPPPRPRKRCERSLKLRPVSPSAGCEASDEVQTCARRLATTALSAHFSRRILRRRHPRCGAARAGTVSPGSHDGGAATSYRPIVLRVVGPAAYIVRRSVGALLFPYERRTLVGRRNSWTYDLHPNLPKQASDCLMRCFGCITRGQ
jgi:hypothetical protein